MEANRERLIMSERKYKAARDLEMAVKEAARKSNQDTGRAIENYYTGRLIERVFSEKEPAFVLKGGRGMLARTINARHTRDTDFLYRGVDIDEAVSELKRLAEIDLSDFLEYRFISAERIAEDQEYREGYRVVFTPIFGGTKTMSDVSIDLVVDRVNVDSADPIVPADRLDIDGLPVFNYLVYPVTNAIADKVCATMQCYSGGRESSRVRDLVDMALYVLTETLDGSDLARKIATESRLRKMGDMTCFTVPASWYERYGLSFAKSVKEAKIPERYGTIAEAEKLVKRCVDPAIACEVDGLTWRPSSLSWE